LDVCQDYALDFLYSREIFHFGVVLKGGTSLRKFRAGSAGRFSTDLDFATPDVDTAQLVVDTLNGAEHHGVVMRVTNFKELRGRIEFSTPLGTTAGLARLEFSPRPLWLPTLSASPIPLPVHKGYEFRPPDLPVPAVEEAIAEKLAAWRRRRKVRDLYDLHWFGQGVLNESLIRRLFALKVWHDYVHDGIGNSPLNPNDVLAKLDPKSFPTEDIGLLTQPVDIATWLNSVRQRYAFAADLDDTEQRLANCFPNDEFWVQQVLAELRRPED
jgi:predicted nucleotidyltransferase component of viral defense system